MKFSLLHLQFFHEFETFKKNSFRCGERTTYVFRKKKMKKKTKLSAFEKEPQRISKIKKSSLKFFI